MDQNLVSLALSLRVNFLVFFRNFLGSFVLLLFSLLLGHVLGKMFFWFFGVPYMVALFSCCLWRADLVRIRNSADVGVMIAKL